MNNATCSDATLLFSGPHQLVPGRCRQSLARSREKWLKQLWVELDYWLNVDAVTAAFGPLYLSSSGVWLKCEYLIHKQDCQAVMTRVDAGGGNSNHSKWSKAMTNKHMKFWKIKGNVEVNWQKYGEKGVFKNNHVHPTSTSHTHIIFTYVVKRNCP